MIDYNFKYRSELQRLKEEQGISLPQLHFPESKLAFRYVFSDKPEKNHLPIYIQTPQRAISHADKSKLTTSGYALSCFENEDKAVTKYNEYRSHSPRIKNTLGDALSYGILNDSDGMITDANKDTHFDLYESASCTLTKTFQIKKSLVWRQSTDSISTSISANS